MHRFMINLRTYLLFVLALCFLSGCSPILSGYERDRQTSPWLDGSWPYEKSELPRHDSALYGRLPNGFRYIIQKNDKPQGRISVNLDVQIGSLMERDNELGIAHYLEHLAFNGSKNFAPGELIPFFQRNGMAFGRDVNAHTSIRETVYKLDLSDNSRENMGTALRFMRDVADGIQITPEEVDKERGVILSEKVARDSANYRAGVRLRAAQFPATRFSNTPIGTEEVISTVSAETIRDFYHAWYRPELMVLAIVGDIDPVVIETQIKELFSSFVAQAPARELPVWGDPWFEGIRTYYDSYPEAGVTGVRISAVHPVTYENDSLNIQRRLLLDMMVNSIISQRFQKLRANGSAPYLGAFSRSGLIYDVVPLASAIARSQPQHWQQSLAVLQDELQRVERFGFLPQEVDQARAGLLHYFRKEARNEADLESDDIVETIVATINGNRVYQSWAQTLEMYEPMLNAITAEALHKAFLDNWDSGNRFVAVSGNAVIEGDARARILDLFEEGQKRSVSVPQKVAALDYPYVEKPDSAGSVVKRSEDNTLGDGLIISERRFANGLLLRMLPTPYDQNKITLSLHLGQGLDGVSDDDYVAAELAFQADSQSGFGRLSFDQANRLRKEQGISVETDLRRYATVLSASGELKDLDKLVEAMWTQFKDPYLDDGNRINMLKSLAVGDEARGRDVSSVSRVESHPFFHGENLRRRPITEEQGQRVSVQQLRQQLQRQLAGGNAVFNAVGDFEPQQLEALIGRFFGASDVTFKESPARHYRPEQSFPGADKSISVAADLGQAELQVAFKAPLSDPHDRRSVEVRRLLASVIREHLRVRVREELGATYSPSAYYYVDNSDGYGYYLISIETTPERMQLLEDVVDKVVAQVAAEGVSSEQLDRQRLPLLSSWSKVREKNQLYANLLGVMAREDLPYAEWVRDKDKLVRSITAEDLSGEAVRVFVDRNKAVLRISEELETTRGD